MITERTTKNTLRCEELQKMAVLVTKRKPAKSVTLEEERKN
jgi:hypothetical protein